MRRLDELAQLGVRVTVRGDRLHVEAPVGVLTPGLRESLRAGKAEIIESLSASSSRCRSSISDSSTPRKRP